jgi:Tfp pilus assembly protein PilN
MALREVNLVPARLLHRRGLLRHICFWGACLFVSLCMIFGFYLYQTHVIRAQQPALQSLDQIQMHLGERLSKIERIRTELQRLKQQRVVLDNITRNRSYCGVLWKLAEIFNDEAWLTQLSIERNRENIERNREKKPAIRMGLTGLSFSNASLGNFMNQISSDPMFNDVQLVYAKEGNRQISKTTSGKPLKLIQFEIESIVSNR